ncbi:hypothetical protein JY651_29715 [Pyxidicoccus parkwayensis]|uniref:Uncharacterized protein n=1 Tax=Pyxidicoccus parkwayensis TaxID=2813578 RepID=A0ABX7NM57_9BACT|nr:hypothetical protein [Pyxidicoccus parkwaysis]QSQ19483.1 hypothetical protein JY651_29715 [Pyxidicoccus parkwaysis]
MNPRLNERTAAAIGACLVLLHAGAVLFSLQSPAQLPLIHQLAGLAASLLSTAGTVMAARAFSPGDYLRRVWTMFAVSAVLLFVASSLRVGWMLAVPEVPFELSALAPVRTLAVVVVNILNPSALVLLALTYRRSGLQPPRSWKTNGLWALCAVVALAIVLPHLSHNVKLLMDGGASVAQTLASVVSALGDIVTILLVAPILRVAYMMRGGKLAWAWWAMAASGAMWIVYDAQQWDRIQGPLALLAVARTAAISLKGLAGVLQRVVLEPEPAKPETAASLRAA